MDYMAGLYGLYIYGHTVWKEGYGRINTDQSEEISIDFPHGRN